MPPSKLPRSQRFLLNLIDGSGLALENASPLLKQRWICVRRGWASTAGSLTWANGRFSSSSSGICHSTRVCCCCCFLLRHDGSEAAIWRLWVVVLNEDKALYIGCISRCLGLSEYTGRLDGHFHSKAQLLVYIRDICIIKSCDLRSVRQWLLSWYLHCWAMSLAPTCADVFGATCDDAVRWPGLGESCMIIFISRASPWIGRLHHIGAQIHSLWRKRTWTWLINEYEVSRWCHLWYDAHWTHFLESRRLLFQDWLHEFVDEYARLRVFGGALCRLWLIRFEQLPI